MVMPVMLLITLVLVMVKVRGGGGGGDGVGDMRKAAVTMMKVTWGRLLILIVMMLMIQFGKEHSSFPS